MLLPRPSASFTLPSLYDNLELNCRLYFPKFRSNESHEPCRGLSVFAHPYAPLGGSFDDPVVQSIGSLLVSQGFLLVTLNFRGAEGSSGKTSWTGKAELGDLSAVYAFAMSFLNVKGVSRYLQHDAPRLLLGGYSYGSMITSYLPAPGAVINIIRHASEGTAEFEINERADKLAKAFLGFCETRDQRGRSTSDNIAMSPTHATFGGYESTAAATKIRRESSRHSVDVERVRQSIDRVRHKLSSRGSDEHHSQANISEGQHEAFVEPEICYLLISPLFGAVSSFATMFASLKFERHDRQATGARDNNVTNIEENLSSNHSLVVFGTHDHFTSSKKTREWCERVKSRSGSRLQFREISDANHFWHNHEVEGQLLATVQSWLNGLAI